MLVGVGLDQARIDRKAFTANQAGRDAGPDARSNMLRKISLSRKRSLRARENTE